MRHRSLAVTTVAAACLAAPLAALNPTANAGVAQQDPLGTALAPVCSAPANLSQLVVTLSLLGGVPTETLTSLLVPLYEVCGLFPVPTERTVCSVDRATDPLTAGVPADPVPSPVGSAIDILRSLLGEEAAQPLSDALECSTAPIAPPLDDDGTVVDPVAPGASVPPVPAPGAGLSASVDPFASPPIASPDTHGGTAGTEGSGNEAEPARSASERAERSLGLALLLGSAIGALVVGRRGRPDAVAGIGRFRTTRTGEAPAL